MLAIEVELLTGCYTATHFNDRTVPEWPPHPARLYSAMVNAWGESDAAADEADALRWMEDLGDPLVSCSIRTGEPSTNEVAFRSPTTHFVPVNDPMVARDLSVTYRRLVDARDALAAARADGEPTALAKAEKAVAKAESKAVTDSHKAASAGGASLGSLEILPDQRGKQGRAYPTVRPAHPVVTFCWPRAEPSSSVSDTVDSLLARVGRLGHSSSLVSCRVVETAPDASYEPSEGGATLIRLPGPGQLDRLVELHATHQGREPRQLPARMRRYRFAQRQEAPLRTSVLDDTFLAAALVGGAQLSIRSSLPFAQAVRNAVLHHAGRNGREIPELISGHAPRAAGAAGSSPSSGRSHMAVVPLPFVGHPHADGLIKGVAILCPGTANSDDPRADDRRHLLRAVGQWLESDAPNLSGRPLGGQTFTLATESGERPAVTLRRQRWQGPARRWATVTPIVLDHYPDGLWRGSPAKRARAEAEAIASIASSCRHIGLPDPAWVEIRSDAAVVGAAAVRRHPAFRSGPNRTPRVMVNAVIEFDEPVIGPVILGRGRYLGQGLCVPLAPEADDA